jgi:transcriptional regulator with XRE-family HTH domain
MSQALGRTLSQLREGKDISQAELAREAGLSQSLVNRIEQGLRRPSLGTVDKLARALGVAPSVLLTSLDEEAVGETD